MFVAIIVVVLIDAKGMDQRFVDHLSLAMYLSVERCAEFHLTPKHFPKRLLEMAKKLAISIKDNGERWAVMCLYVLEISFVTWGAVMSFLHGMKIEFWKIYKQSQRCKHGYTMWLVIH